MCDQCVSLRWDHLALLLLCALLPAHTPTAMGFYVFGKLISPRKRSYFILDFFANSLWPLFWPAFLACSTLSLIFKRFRLRWNLLGPCYWWFWCLVCGLLAWIQHFTCFWLRSQNAPDAGNLLWPHTHAAGLLFSLETLINQFLWIIWSRTVDLCKIQDNFMKFITNTTFSQILLGDSWL